MIPPALSEAKCRDVTVMSLSPLLCSDRALAPASDFEDKEVAIKINWFSLLGNNSSISKASPFHWDETLGIRRKGLEKIKAQKCEGQNPVAPKRKSFFQRGPKLQFPPRLYSRS